MGPDQKTLTEIFGEFAGKEIQMENKPWEYEGETYDQWQPVENEPTLEAMQDAAKASGLTLRTWFPGMMGTMDYRTDRVNVHIEQDSKGAWRVGNDFSIG